MRSRPKIGTTISTTVLTVTVLGATEPSTAQTHEANEAPLAAAFRRASATGDGRPVPAQVATAGARAADWAAVLSFSRAVRAMATAVAPTVRAARRPATAMARIVADPLSIISPPSLRPRRTGRTRPRAGTACRVGA